MEFLGHKTHTCVNQLFLLGTCLVLSPLISSAFHTSSGTTFAHSGITELGKVKLAIACLIAFTWAVKYRKTIAANYNLL